MELAAHVAVHDWLATFLPAGVPINARWDFEDGVRVFDCAAADQNGVDRFTAWDIILDRQETKDRLLELARKFLRTNEDFPRPCFVVHFDGIGDTMHLGVANIAPEYPHDEPRYKDAIN